MDTTHIQLCKLKDIGVATNATPRFLKLDSTKQRRRKQMADMAKIRQILPIHMAVKQYGTTDKEKFQCAYPEYEEQRPDSTFYADFSVADYYGEKAIQDTFNRAFNGWKSNCKMFTELVAMLNHKLWFWYECGITEYSELYDKLYKQADAYGSDNFKGEELKHFYYVLD